MEVGPLSDATRIVTSSAGSETGSEAGSETASDCGAALSAGDLRGGAALVLAAMKADGYSTIENVHHIDRGYENIETLFGALGADIVRTK